MLTYICKYTPLELLLAFRAGYEMPNNDVPDFARTDTVIHSSVCSHAKMLIYALMKDQDEKKDREMVLTNCCDSIRRVYDTVADDHFSFKMMLDLPHRTEGYAVELYTKELMKLARAYEEHCGHPFDRKILIESWQKNAEAWQEMMNTNGKFIAVLGARPSDELFQKIRASLPYPAIDLTCGGLRSLPMPPEELVRAVNRDNPKTGAPSPSNPDCNMSDAQTGDENMPSDEEILRAYAKALLSQIPCMRMEDPSGRSALLCKKELAGIVYHSIRFCDYYSYEYAQLRRESDLPILKIESDYTAQSEGQLSTRLDAFGESLGALEQEVADHGARQKAADASGSSATYTETEADDTSGTSDVGNSVGSAEASRQRQIFQNIQTSKSAGETDKMKKNPIFSLFRNPFRKNASQQPGSTGHSEVSHGSTHSVAAKANGADSSIRAGAPTVADESLNVYIGIDSGSTTTNGAAIDDNGNLLASSIVRTGARAGDAAQRVYDNLKSQLGANASRIQKIIATGYGRDHIDFADAVKTEISCHAKGAHFCNPEARTIIDIGGQDSKVICLDEDGNVMNFVMNDKCAAGTGRFLEMMAHTLEMSLDEMGEKGLTWKKDLTITSTCTVFAESEVVSLVAENSETNDIIHALDKSVAKKTRSMVKRVQGKAPYMMTGGVAKNKGVVKELERNLGAPLAVMEHPDLIGAIGAALFAQD